MADTNKQIHLVSRPTGEPEAANFALIETPVPSPGAGQVLLKTLYLSLDPYMRARMYEGANYAANTPLNAPMVGDTVSEVMESHHPDFTAGDIVVSRHGWQSHALSDGADLKRVDPSLAPISTALSVLGMPAHTGYGGLLRFGKPEAGETLLVSAATGAVGSVVAQIGRIKGLRTVGIAGGTDKCRYLVDTLGLDGAIDRRAGDFAGQLKATCPNGVDIYYDNVAGDIAAEVLPVFNTGGRYLVCGTIAINRDLGYPEGADNLQKMLATVLVKKLTVQGFIFPDFLDMTEAFLSDMSGWIKSGDVKYQEHVVEGIENAPQAFLGLFKGENFGKLLVKVA